MLSRREMGESRTGGSPLLPAGELLEIERWDLVLAFPKWPTSYRSVDVSTLVFGAVQRRGDSESIAFPESPPLGEEMNVAPARKKIRKKSCIEYVQLIWRPIPFKKYDRILGLRCFGILELKVGKSLKKAKTRRNGDSYRSRNPRLKVNYALMVIE